jgi:hypothetical protein
MLHKITTADSADVSKSLYQRFFEVLANRFQIRRVVTERSASQKKKSASLQKKPKKTAKRTPFNKKN